jgi:hypothetical protein
MFDSENILLIVFTAYCTNTNMDQTLRYLSPYEHDRVQKLLERYPCEYPNLTTQFQLVKIFRDSKKYTEILEKIELFVLKQAGFNFVVKNVPEFAELRESRTTVRVGLEEMRETLEQFGRVENIGMVRDVVYARFDNPEPCHRLINCMQLGRNILSTKIC